MSAKVANGVGGLNEFVYANKKAWHGQGLEVPAGTSVAAAITGTAMGSEMLCVPVLMPVKDLSRLDNIKLPTGAEPVAIVRAADWRCMGIATDSYRPIQPMDAARMLDGVAAAVEGIAFTAAGTIREGSVFWAQAAAGKFDVVGNGDVVESYLTFVDGYDGRTCASFGLTTVRAVCQNTITHAVACGKKSVVWHKIRHVGGVNDRVRSAAAAAQEALAAVRGVRNFYRAAAQTPITVDVARDVFARALRVPDLDALTPQARGKVDVMTDLFRNGTGNAGKTAWDALSAVSEWSTWAQPVRVDTRWAKAILGDDVAQSAESLLRAYVATR